LVNGSVSLRRFFVVELGRPGQEAAPLLHETLKGGEVLAGMVLLQPSFAHDRINVALLEFKTAAPGKTVAQEDDILRQTGEGAVDGINAELGGRQQEDLSLAPVSGELSEPLDFPHAIGIKATAGSFEVESDFVHAQDNPAEVWMQALGKIDG